MSSDPMPTAERGCIASCPNAVTSRSEQPSMTFGCTVGMGIDHAENFQKATYLVETADSELHGGGYVQNRQLCNPVSERKSFRIELVAGLVQTYLLRPKRRTLRPAPNVSTVMPQAAT
jgi:hypothetical protein